MSELPQKNNKPPIEITDDIQGSLNRLGRDLETHAESGIRIGKELLYLKEVTPHGKFKLLIEWAFGITSRQCGSYMSIAEKYGNQIGSCLPFSSSVLIELSRPSVPESARKEAEEHDALTVKQAKELAAANKRIKELTKQNNLLLIPPKPNLDNLILELDKLYRGGSIVLARANELSVLDHKAQEVYLSEFHSKEFHRKEADRAKDKAEKAMDKAMRAIEEKEEALKKLEDASGTDNAKIMMQHQKELKELQESYLEQLKEAKTQAEKDALDAMHKDIQDAFDAKDTAEKSKKKAQDKASAAYKAQGELEIKIKKLEEQLEVNNPTNVDLAMEKQIRSTTNSVMFVLKELRHEMMSIGGGMERSIEAVQALKDVVSMELAELTGDITEIIDI